MNVTLCSAFRDSADYVTQHRLQVCRLAYALHQRGDHLHVVWCEGDSTDDTYARLLDAYARDGDHCGYTCDIFQYHHGGQDYGSIEHPQRFKQLAGLWNAIWQRIPQDADTVITCESDLVWETETMMALIDHLATYPAIAPMIFDQSPSDRFRDVYAFRRNGEHFTNHAPYHADLNGEVLQVDSAGSVLAMRGELARNLNMPEADAVVGLCRHIYEQGGAVYVDPALKVMHP